MPGFERYAKNMKTLIIIFAMLIQLASAAQPKEEAPKEGFADKGQLEAWSRTSAFGGGSAGEINVNGRKIYYTNRSFTSGRETTQVSLFYIAENGHIVPFANLPISPGSSKVTVKEGKVIVSQTSGISMDIKYTIKPEHIPKT